MALITEKALKVAEQKLMEVNEDFEKSTKDYNSNLLSKDEYVQELMNEISDLLSIRRQFDPINEKDIGKFKARIEHLIYSVTNCIDSTRNLLNDIRH